MTDPAVTGINPTNPTSFVSTVSITVMFLCMSSVPLVPFQTIFGGRIFVTVTREHIPCKSKS